MRRETWTLLAFTLLVTWGAAACLAAQDEHEPLRLQMAATHGQAVALFQQVKASPNMQGQPGAAFHTMQARLDQLGALLAASACNPEHYARLNHQLLALWHRGAGASTMITADSDRLQVLDGRLLQEQGTMQRWAAFHARQEAAAPR